MWALRVGSPSLLYRVPTFREAITGKTRLPDFAAAFERGLRGDSPP